MNILITGGYGNIGLAVINQCLKQGHIATVFEIKNNRSKKLSSKFKRKSVKTIFGDIRVPGDVDQALTNQDAVIHLAAILPPLSDEKPILCNEVNVTGIRNLIESILKNGNKAVLIEVSSASVMGCTQNKTPPIKSTDKLTGIDTYSKTKIEAEAIVEKSGVKFGIYRLAGVSPTYININYFLNMIKVMFDMPLNARCEIVLDIDVAFALVVAAEQIYKKNELRGDKGFIAGGKTNGCQLTNREMLSSVFNEIGLVFPRDELFSDDINNYYLDWYDTVETQNMLKYQNHTFEQWKTLIKKYLYFYQLPLFLLRKPILKWLEKQSKKYKNCPNNCFNLI